MADRGPFKVFMTRRDTLTCVHEPFGDAFYYGPERLSERYENDVQARIDSGFSQTTFQTVLDRLYRDDAEVRPLSDYPFSMPRQYTRSLSRSVSDPWFAISYLPVLDPKKRVTCSCSAVRTLIASIKPLVPL